MARKRTPVAAGPRPATIDCCLRLQPHEAISLWRFDLGVGRPVRVEDVLEYLEVWLDRDHTETEEVREDWKADAENMKEEIDDLKKGLKEAEQYAKDLEAQLHKAQTEANNLYADLKDLLGELEGGTDLSIQRIKAHAKELVAEYEQEDKWGPVGGKPNVRQPKR